MADKQLKAVLVIEDSDATRSLIVSVLEGLGSIRAFQATSGFEALRVLPTQDFDLVLTDINMPDINGLEVVSFLKKTERYKHIPVVIITTESGTRDRMRGLDLGAQRYITKPFDIAELRATVEELLGLGSTSQVL